uniref:ZP domain-containing protein n=1 Tax=Ditylenchus dipsaci TaxID=166011 RepID=A0A915EQE0_9BILA
MVDPVKPFSPHLLPKSFTAYIPTILNPLNRLSSKCLLLATLVFLVCSCQGSSELENGIIGSPTVECEKEYIKFKVPTKHVFKGKVYVKGEYTNNDCVHSYASGHESGTYSSTNHKPDDIGLAVVRGSNERQPAPPPPASKPDKSDSEEPVSERGKSSSRESSSRERVPSTYSNRTSSSPEREEDYEHQVMSGEEETPKLGEYPQPPPVVFTKEKGKGYTLGPPTDAEFEVTDTYNRQEEEPSTKQFTSPSSSTASKKRTNSKNPSSHSSKHQSFTPGIHQSSHLPGFSATAQTANWRNFLRGRPGLDGQSFRRYGSKVSPDANGECPLICPPCDDCRSKYTYDGSSSDDSRGGSRRRRTAEHAAELEIRLGACNTRRDRMASPPGVHISFTVIVSFHDSFITKVDRAYHIECAYEESDHTVTTQMDVSQPPTVQLSGTVQAPQCQYKIQAPGEGGVLTNVRVGDSVQHEWHCTSAAQDAGEAVESDDGKGRKERVVDDKGCSTDNYILPTPTYSHTSLSASATSLVAKFPDRDLLGFQCSITVCMKELGHCEGVTPPKCDIDTSKASDYNNVRSRRKRSHEDDNNTNDTENEQHGKGQDEYWQLHAQMLTVFDFDAELDDKEKPDVFTRMLHTRQLPTTSTANKEPLKERLLFNTSTDFCVSVTAFGLLIASSTFLVTVSTAAILAILLWKNPFYIEK